jgi:hypothetical protein
MTPRCVTGSGHPPRYVSQIRYRRGEGGTLHLEGGYARDESIDFSSRPDLLEQCRILAERHILFSLGGHVPGPADEMMMWHDDGSLSVSFLQISWTGPQQWVIREIIPGAKPPWRSVELSDILSA